MAAIKKKRFLCGEKADLTGKIGFSGFFRKIAKAKRKKVPGHHFVCTMTGRAVCVCRGHDVLCCHHCLCVHGTYKKICVWIWEKERRRSRRTLPQLRNAAYKGNAGVCTWFLLRKRKRSLGSFSGEHKVVTLDTTKCAKKKFAREREIKKTALWVVFMRGP